MAGRRLPILFRHLRPMLTPPVKRSTLAITTPAFRRFSSVSRTSNKLEVNGVNFHFERAGKGEHAVLLLPGCLGCSVTDFDPQLEGLNRDKYTVIAFDPRGYGKSRPPNRDWPLQFFQRDAEDASALMQKLGFSRFSILGWSDGGITGLVLSGLFPANIKKLIVWGANAYLTEQDLELFGVIDDLDKWSERMKAPFLKVYGEEYLRSQLKQWTAAIRRYYNVRNGDICVGSLPNIKCETLIVNGHKDALVPQEHPLFLNKHIPNSKMVDWPEGKHNLHLRYADDFNKLVEDFLDS